jgi:hypothetical protein
VGGRWWRRSQIMRQREIFVLYKSFNTLWVKVIVNKEREILLLIMHSQRGVDRILVILKTHEKIKLFMDEQKG